MKNLTKITQYLGLERLALEEAEAFLKSLDQAVINQDQNGRLLPGDLDEGFMVLTWDLAFSGDEDEEGGDPEKNVRTAADVDELDEAELQDLIRRECLEIDPDKYLGVDDLREAVKEELGLSPAEDEEGEEVDVSLGAYLWVPGEAQGAALSLFATVNGGSYRKRWRMVKKLCRNLKGEIHLHNPHWDEDELEIKRYPLDETLEIAIVAKELVAVAEKVEDLLS